MIAADFGAMKGKGLEGGTLAVSAGTIYSSVEADAPQLGAEV
jgi:hypothetical protein